MYTRIYYDKFANEMHLWDDKEGYKKFPYQKYAYLLDDNGDVETINGKKVRKVTSWPETAEKLGLVFEHDVRPEMRTLIDLYYKNTDLPENRILCLDIEVRKNERYSQPIDADNEIVSIAYKLSTHSEYNIYIFNESFERETRKTEIKIPETGETLTVNVNIFESEVSMLTSFMHVYEEMDPTILTGWNIDFFDIPYMYNRMLKVCNANVANSLSPIKKVKRNFTVDNKLSVSIAGRSIVDGMGLYKKFTYSEQPSYALEAISQAELGRGKVSYEGNLDQLFETDFNRFVYYNVVDVELPIALDAKLGYMDIAIATCHKGFVPYDDISYPSMYIEGAILAFIKNEGKVSTSSVRKHEEPARGAFVKDPTAGLYKWVYDLDLTSLYPWNIISLNISPDTKYGRIINYNEEEYVNNVDRRYKVELLQDTSIEGFFSKFTTDSNILEFNSKTELEQWIVENNLSFSSIGILYTLDKIGIIPQILSKWFDERQEYKELMTNYGKSGDIDKEKYYDKKQLVVKVLLNSVYGVLLLQSFRFNDKENGESTTLTGQSVIQWATKKANEYYFNILQNFNYNYNLIINGKSIVKNGFDIVKLKSTGNRYVFMLKVGDDLIDGKIESIKNLNTGGLNTPIDFCIYTDTDSVFFPLEPLLYNINKDFEQLSDSEIIQLSKPLINDVQNHINESFNEYAKTHHNVTKHGWNIKQELIARRAFWLSVKKRYAQWIVSKGKLEKNEMDVKGLDSVRSSFPKLFRKFVNNVLKAILHDKDSEFLNETVIKFKELIKTAPVTDIMLPTSIKDIDKYTTDEFNKFKSATPAHVQAALNYNMLLKRNGEEGIPPINNGDKILWAYLIDNPLKLDKLAINRGFEYQPALDYVTQYIDRDKIFESQLIGKLQAYWTAMDWGMIQLNNKINKFFAF